MFTALLMGPFINRGLVLKSTQDTVKAIELLSEEPSEEENSSFPMFPPSSFEGVPPFPCLRSGVVPVYLTHTRSSLPRSLTLSPQRSRALLCPSLFSFFLL